MPMARYASEVIRGGALGLALACALPAAPALAAPQPARYLWNLSTETGPVRASALSLAFDPYGREVLATGGNEVRIFQANGMEDFSFSGGALADRIVGASVLGESGDIVVLGVTAGRSVLVRVSFRGERLGVIEPKGPPAGFADGFTATAVRVHEGRIYAADGNHLRVLVLEQDGRVVRAVDLAEQLGIPPEKREDNQLSGFGVDLDGGLLFTIAVRFRAYALSPAGELREWGAAGGAPGFFNVVSGIAADARNYYVADKLKSAVIAFDRSDLSFVDEFGYRRPQPLGGLVAPADVVAGNGRVYVSQNAERGVAVFAAPHGEPSKVSAAAPGAGEALAP